MAFSRTGEIRVLTRGGDTAFCLYIKTSCKQLIEPEFDFKKKFSLSINTPQYSTKSDFSSSIISALNCSNNLIAQFFSPYRHKFNESVFNIEIGFEDINRPIMIRGKSASLGITLAILSCVLGFEIRDDVAATGEIDDSGRIHFVFSMKEKLDRFLSDNTLKIFVAPYVGSLYEDNIKKFYSYLPFVERNMNSNQKELVLCSDIFECLLFITEVSEFKKIYTDLDYLQSEKLFLEFEKYKNIFRHIKYDRENAILTKEGLPRRLWGDPKRPDCFRKLHPEPTYEEKERLDKILAEIGPPPEFSPEDDDYELFISSTCYEIEYKLKCFRDSNYAKRDKDPAYQKKTQKMLKEAFNESLKKDQTGIVP